MAEQQESSQVAKEQPVTPKKLDVPNSTGVLVLGILSIITSCCFWGFIGLTLGIISLVLAGKAKKIYRENPEFYTEVSYKNVNAGKVCAIIGICFAGLIVLGFILYLAIVGATLGGIFSTFPWQDFQDALNNY